jgi:hypothetical protein
MTAHDHFTVSVPAVAMLRALKAALSHASQDHTRPHLTCVRVESGDTFRAVATDGHRLIKYDIQGSAGTGKGAALLTAETAKRFVAALASAVKAAPKAARDEVTAELTIGEAATLACEGASVTGPVADETFPPYDKVIPKYALTSEGFTGEPWKAELETFKREDCESFGSARVSSRYVAEAMAVTAALPANGKSIAADFVIRGAQEQICISRSCETESVLIVIMPERRG